MFWLQLIRSFIKILRAGQTPFQIAAGFALGSIVGLSSSFTLQGLCLWLVIFALNVNLSAAFLAFTIFSLLAYLLDPLFHWLGFFLLVESPALRDLWTSLYNAPLAPLTRFNNTVVLGSFVGAVMLFPVTLIAMRQFVIAYRATLGARLEQSKMYRVINQSALVRWYQRVRDFGES